MRLTLDSNAVVVAANIAALTPIMQKRVVAATKFCGGLLLTEVQRNASTGDHPPGQPHIPGTGPGPNVATGDYRRSWNLQMDANAFGVSAKVGTNAVQGPRLEFGFVGVDSIGRHYAQPPYPHAFPALDVIGDRFVTMLRVAVGVI